jgi:hypothetical protein
MPRVTADELAAKLRHIADGLELNPHEPHLPVDDKLVYAHNALLVLIDELADTITPPRETVAK